MSSYISPKTIGIACGAIGLIAYCIYFDRKRRSDPNYREKVQARRERERKSREEQDEVELPPENNKSAMEKFFVREIEIGEELIQAGEVDRAVKHLSYAVVFCPQPSQLLAYMKEILPTDAYKKLVDSLEVVNKRVVEKYSNIKVKSPVEEDVE